MSLEVLEERVQLLKILNHNLEVIKKAEKEDDIGKDIYYSVEKIMWLMNYGHSSEQHLKLAQIALSQFVFAFAPNLNLPEGFKDYIKKRARAISDKKEEEYKNHKREYLTRWSWRPDWGPVHCERDWMEAQNQIAKEAYDFYKSVNK